MFPVPVTFFFSAGLHDETLRRNSMAEFAAAGAKHLVLTHEMIKLILHDTVMMDLLNKEMESEWLTFVDAHAPYGEFDDLNVPQEHLKRQMFLRHKLHVHIAADMGVNTLTIHTGNEYYHPHIPLDKQIDNVCSALDEILPVAEERNVTVCIENIWCRLNTAEVLLKIKERFPTGALGFCFDAGHANNVAKGYLYERNSVFDAYILTNTPAVYDDKVLEKMLPHIVNCHLHDNNGQFDTHRNIGDGNTNWQKIMPLLVKAPRLKCIQSEIIPKQNELSPKEICDAVFNLVNTK
ncbi:MAG: sugar phosphate isomerase/epimerase [Lentisphaerae bacterium]|nr:sugar phosphate isomerase/epimerase [Lentisphaerota bacterium]